jgi:molybdate transport system regulatory protein
VGFNLEGGAVKVRTKVWIEDDHGKVVFGVGRVRMLEAIGRLGSMNKAAKALKMSYRGLWARIKSTENRIGARLVTTRPGGAKVSGSILTPTGKKFLKNYKLLVDSVVQQTDHKFEQIFGNTRTDET